MLSTLDLGVENFESLYALCTGRDRSTQQPVGRYIKTVPVETAMKAFDVIGDEGRKTVRTLALQPIKEGPHRGQQRVLFLRSPLINEALKRRHRDANVARAFVLLAAASLRVRDVAIMAW